MSLTLVPHPTKKPNPSVDAADGHDETDPENEGSNEGTTSETSRGLDSNPPRINRFSGSR